MERLIHSDRTALNEVYDHYAGRVYGIALRIVRDPLAAEEVTQDVFLSAWSHRLSFDRRRGQLDSWLLTAARNRAIDVTRQARRRRLDSEIPAQLPAPSAVEDSVIARLTRDAIIVALARLPDAQRFVIEHAYFGGYTAREQAIGLGLPLSTIKGRMRMGLLKLADDLDLRAAT